jgi:hypothetical protein
VPLAHANPSYSGGRDQEDLIQSQPRQNSSQDPLSQKKNNHKKRIGVVAQGVHPEFELQYCKNKTKLQRGTYIK